MILKYHELLSDFRVTTYYIKFNVFINIYTILNLLSNTYFCIKKCNHLSFLNPKKKKKSNHLRLSKVAFGYCVSCVAFFAFLFFFLGRVSGIALSLNSDFRLMNSAKCVNSNCGAKGPGYPSQFRILSPWVQSRRKTSEDD